MVTSKVEEILPKKHKMDKFLMLALIGVVLTVILALIYYFVKVSHDSFQFSVTPEKNFDDVQFIPSDVPIILKNNGKNESLGSGNLGAELSLEQTEFKVLLENVSQAAIALCILYVHVGGRDRFTDAALEMGMFLRKMDLQTLLDKQEVFESILYEFITRGREAHGSDFNFASSPNTLRGIASEFLFSYANALGVALRNLWTQFRENYWSMGGADGPMIVMSPYVTQLIQEASETMFDFLPFEFYPISL